MTNNLIIIAGATGDLGRRVAKYLLKLNARVRVLSRRSTQSQSINELQQLGCEIQQVDYSDVEQMASALEGAHCVVSCLSGLEDVIVDAQYNLYLAVLEANVKRFFPSDFAIDYTKIPEKSNRNLNLRLKFYQKISDTPIEVTSILNGAFTNMLKDTAPFLLYKIRRALHWGNAQQLLDFTTIDNTAEYTAHAALDEKTPRWLKISGDEISPRGLAVAATNASGKKFKTFRPGGLTQLKIFIAMTKFFTPKSNDLYPAWQGMQYFHSMFGGKPKFEKLDNDRYDIKWTKVEDFLREEVFCTE
ncbi:NmrA family NAD(P)-binding protein [Candidatus Uabimicrobium amorphum]|uniref:NmrA-like domain-containing protein n=1 Tax=Uabimicrobium amorphum TaxID=2596890 RepID=A0A5S9F0S7_UABAM|nr:NmrA family NAD(P)-binding protein [Candidatus Uabimicrobium amorphum]BBM81816.1 hypothetical protein UABAM_00155 [Candidatus Uabimicrobium amorphum]